MTFLVGGVGELYQGDMDVGRLAADRLTQEDLGPEVVVEDLYYGALAVTQLLEDLRPSAMVLVGAAARGRAPGSVERRRIVSPAPHVQRFRTAVEQAGTGHVSIDLILEVAGGFDALPARTVTIEVEPVRREPSESLSGEVRSGLDRALELTRLEVTRLPLLELSDRLRGLVVGDRLQPAPALEVMRDLLSELDHLDHTGRWGRTFSRRDELRFRIASGETGDGMDHLDWSQWWAVIEELDRLQAAEGAVP
ncbi:MAG: hypothetical protein ABJC60_04140 [Actinomycetota bacterium]